MLPGPLKLRAGVRASGSPGEGGGPPGEGPKPQPIVPPSPTPSPSLPEGRPQRKGSRAR